MWNIDELLNKLDIDFTRLHDLLVYDPHAPMIFSSGIFLWLFAAFIVFYLLFAASHYCPPDVRYPVFLLFLL